MSERKTREQWREVCAGLRESGMSVAEYAEAIGVNPRTLSWWRSRLAVCDRRADQMARPAESGFLELVAAPALSEARVTIRIGAVELEAAGWPSAAWVAELVARC